MIMFIFYPHCTRFPSQAMGPSFVQDQGLSASGGKRIMKVKRQAATHSRKRNTMNSLNQNSPLKILATGGCGFIGANFIRHALEIRPAWHIINLDALTYAGNPSNLSNLPPEQSERYRFVRGDIRDSNLLSSLFSEEPVDAVVHFAAESHVDRSILGPEAFVETNVLGTFRLLEAARRHWEKTGNPAGFRFLNVSTDEVYGSLGPEGYFSESNRYDPSSPYSASKAAADHFVRAYHRTYGLPTLITNCSNNYGPYQFPEKLIPLMILNIMEQKPLPVYGDGTNIRDWLYVIDHCEALIRVLEQGTPGKTYNIGGNEEKTNIDIVRSLCSFMDNRLNTHSENRSAHHLINFVKDRPGHDRRYAIDATRIRNDLGWSPRFSFEEALGSTIDWYLANMDWVDSVRTGRYQEWIKKQYGGATVTAGE
jgi:dTDP-glucose 4,6-dehydratase